MAAVIAPDLLSLIESRWREAGCGDEDKRWLIGEMKKLRGELDSIAIRAVRHLLDEALNSGRGVYQP